jgi:hypothetical protein
MLQYEYAREALKNGLRLEQPKLGTNPYKFGMVGSTDSHTSLTTAEEENFFGKHSQGTEPSPHRMEHPVYQFGDITVYGMGAGGARATRRLGEENTREAIWDAMKRKEVYATTGPRMLVRFFGGWDFDAADANSRLPAEAGYEKGVPMGGDLRAAPAGRRRPSWSTPSRTRSGNLDRIQIVKGWLDATGETHEKVYDVVWGDADPPPGPDGKLPPVGNTVDVANATWTNTIGDPELIAVWTDPDFDASQRAFYYARVIEIPTPVGRRTTVDPGVLLTLEAERIRATGGAWNHDVVGLGYWHPDPPRGRDESAPRWLPALVMPHHPGATLASFPPSSSAGSSSG